MAEFDFILSESEQVKMIDILFDLGGRIVPDIWYKEPVYEFLTTTEQVMNVRPKLVGTMFLVHDDFTQYSLEFKRIDKEDGVYYYLAQGNGGPYLDFDPCHLKQDGGKTHLLHGSIGYLQSYWQNNLQESIPVTSAVKQHYKGITKYLKSITTKLTTEPPKRSYWVGHEALQMLRAGATTNAAGLILPTAKVSN